MSAGVEERQRGRNKTCLWVILVSTRLGTKLILKMRHLPHATLLKTRVRILLLRLLLLDLLLLGLCHLLLDIWIKVGQQGVLRVSIGHYPEARVD